MNHAFILMCFYFLVGVFGDEVKSVSVMVGDSVTLHTNITEIQKDIEIVWWFEEIYIARIKRSVNINPTYENTEETQRFRGRLEMNNQTGDLMITDIRYEHSGVYQLKISIGNNPTNKRFNLKAYAPPPVPVITNDIPQCSIFKCVLLCSVLNVRDVNLSWYKGNSLLSSISVSDLKTKASLPLDVETHDNNTYSCVVNNPITNQTQHLNINEVCQPCSVLVIYLIFRLVVTSVMGVAAVAAVIVLGYDIKSRRDEHKRILQRSPATSNE